MKTPVSSFLQSIDAATLTPIVRQSLRRDAFQLQGWQVNQFAGGFGNPVSLGLYRFEGTGQDRDPSGALVGDPKTHSVPGECGLG